LCAEAAGGQILISQRVYAAIGDIALAEPLGELALKGFHKPVMAYSVTGQAESLPASVA
jgi:class 3 adenylate cyclase